MSKICHICLEDRLIKPFTLSCGHEFCHSCLKGYVDSQINCGICDIKCFHPTRNGESTCKQFLRDKDIKALTTTKMWKKALKWKKKHLLSAHGKVRECPYCEHIEKFEGDENIQKCSSCEKRYCAIHGRAHAWNVSCKEFEADQEQISQKIINDTCTKCPGCSEGVQKSYGCNHMTCTKCDTHFCFLCGEKLVRPVYPHYNDNSIRNVLFGCGGMLYLKQKPSTWTRLRMRFSLARTIMWRNRSIASRYLMFPTFVASLWSGLVSIREIQVALVLLIPIKRVSWLTGILWERVFKWPSKMWTPFADSYYLYMENLFRALPIIWDSIVPMRRRWYFSEPHIWMLCHDIFGCVYCLFLIEIIWSIFSHLYSWHTHFMFYLVLLPEVVYQVFRPNYFTCHKFPLNYIVCTLTLMNELYFLRVLPEIYKSPRSTWLIMLVRNSLTSAILYIGRTVISSLYSFIFRRSQSFISLMLKPSPRLLYKTYLFICDFPWTLSTFITLQVDYLNNMAQEFIKYGTRLTTSEPVNTILFVLNHPNCSFPIFLMILFAYFFVKRRTSAKVETVGESNFSLTQWEKANERKKRQRKWKQWQKAIFLGFFIALILLDSCFKN